jgi:hypothetical protein
VNRVPVNLVTMSSVSAFRDWISLRQVSVRAYYWLCTLCEAGSYRTELTRSTATSRDISVIIVTSLRAL